ncbi:hypothetical protein HMPREF9554_01087 [Treponema phagedenis F0421]|nr:hypothetical protein HMPREF9554_01087 [Treponema phagedenis F0421]
MRLLNSQAAKASNSKGSPLPNSKRCFKASTANYKIEAFKLASS